MNVAAPEFIRAALDLPEAARADLAHQLLESLPNEAFLNEESPEFLATLDQRAEDLISGRVAGLSWEAVQSALQESLRARAE